MSVDTRAALEAATAQDRVNIMLVNLRATEVGAWPHRFTIGTE